MFASCNAFGGLNQRDVQLVDGTPGFRGVVAENRLAETLAAFSIVIGPKVLRHPHADILMPNRAQPVAVFLNCTCHSQLSQEFIENRLGSPGCGLPASKQRKWRD